MKWLKIKRNFICKKSNKTCLNVGNIMKNIKECIILLINCLQINIIKLNKIL